MFSITTNGDCLLQKGIFLFAFETNVLTIVFKYLDFKYYRSRKDITECLLQHFIAFLVNEHNIKISHFKETFNTFTMLYTQSHQALHICHNRRKLGGH